ncbi:MAG TPA: M23 family metallopeptidase [Azospirillaceae bacterium]|nr:M23 family metallopeptidase [Azospirillaceae bacterium]
MRQRTGPTASVVTLAAVLAILAPAAPRAAGPTDPTRDGPRLRLPLDCRIGETCFVQNNVDLDPGPGVRDWACGHLGYDGDRGADFRLPDLAAMERGVAVVAAAAGTVHRVRDGEPDTGKAGLAPGREAGNGVIIDHGGGWETQYSHLKRGSIRVRPGQPVAAGTPLGLVGMSGSTEFPHVEMQVRHNGKIVDPWAGPVETAVCGDTSRSLWEPSTLASLAYRPTGVLTAGFAFDRADPQAARRGAYADLRLAPDAGALVFWVDLFGVQAGDRTRLRIRRPDGAVFADSEDAIERNQAVRFLFAGRRRPAEGWMPGAWMAEFTLTRGNSTVVETTRRIEMR